MAEPDPVTNAKDTGESTAAIDDASITDLLKDSFLLEDKQRSKPTTKPTRSMTMPCLDQFIETTAERFESEELKKSSQASDVSLDNADKPPHDTSTTGSKRRKPAPKKTRHCGSRHRSLNQPRQT